MISEKIIKENNIPIPMNKGKRFWMYKYKDEIISLYTNKTMNEIKDIM